MESGVSGSASEPVDVGKYFADIVLGDVEDPNKDIAIAATEVLTERLNAVELDPVAVDAGRLAGRVEVLLWAQSELQLELAELQRTDRFADTRQLENFLKRVQDSLVAVQDGSGTWAGLIRSGVGDSTVGGSADDPVPGA